MNEHDELLKKLLEIEPVIEELNDGRPLDKEFFRKKEEKRLQSIYKEGQVKEQCPSCNSIRYVYPHQMNCGLCGAPYLRLEDQEITNGRK